MKCSTNSRTEYHSVNRAVNFIRGFGNETKILKNANWYTGRTSASLFSDLFNIAGLFKNGYYCRGNGVFSVIHGSNTQNPATENI